MAKTIWNVAGLAVNPVAITPADDGTHEFELISVDVAGDVTFTPYGQPHSAAITMQLDAGFHPIPVTRIWESSTATGIRGWSQG